MKTLQVDFLTSADLGNGIFKSDNLGFWIEYPSNSSNVNELTMRRQAMTLLTRSMETVFCFLWVALGG